MVVSLAVSVAGFAALMALPIKVAADFTDGERTGLLMCLLASVVAPVAAVLVFRAVSGGFGGFCLAFFALLASYVAILKIPGRSVVGFSVMLLGLQLATYAALLSFGYNVGSAMAGWAASAVN